MSRAGVLMLDEVVTGFRLAHGGAQELYGVAPDLATLTCGDSLAAIAGRPHGHRRSDAQGHARLGVATSV